MILKLCVSLSQVRILLPDCWKNLSLVSTKVQSITYAHNCYEILAVEPWGTCVSKSLPFNPGVFDSFPYPPWRTIAVHVGVGHFSVCPLAHSMLCLSFLLFSLEFYFSFSLPLPPFPSSLHCQTEMGETWVNGQVLIMSSCHKGVHYPCVTLRMRRRMKGTAWLATSTACALPAVLMLVFSSHHLSCLGYACLIPMTCTRTPFRLLLGTPEICLDR